MGGVHRSSLIGAREGRSLALTGQERAARSTSARRRSEVWDDADNQNSRKSPERLSTVT